MPITELAANHLWQSTAFAAVAALLALALRANHARARYWLWLAASVKFLVPFSALAAIGGGLGRWLAPAAPVTRLPLVMEQIVQPFGSVQDAVAPMAVSAPTPNMLPALLLAIWFCGFVAVLLYAWKRWRRVAAAVRSSTPLMEGRALEALWKVGQAIRLPLSPRLVSSTAKLEPGVFGIFRPVLWLPAGIADRLEDAELEAILTHELCHIRRRDNLLAAIHMLVEAIFWFHPLVWWLGARLEEERERACDEEVVRMGGEPQIYAESILKVVEFYLASPVACAAGVTGGELKKRIEGIMTNRFARELSYGKRVLLASAVILVTSGPVVVGLLNPPPGRAQSQAGGATPVFEVASVKPAQPPTGGAFRSGVFGGPGKGDPGHISYSYMSLARLVMEAYGINASQLSGPDWINETRFDIVANIPPETTKEQVPIMLQNLLAERIRLKVHREARTMTVYELTVASVGPKLRAADDKSTSENGISGQPRLSAKDGFPEIPAGRNGGMQIDGRARWQAYDATMQDLAKMLTREVHAPVADATGLGGRYDMSLSWVTAEAALGSGESADTIAGPTLFAAVSNQLGLRLVAKKGPVDMLIIDSADKVPSGN